MSASLSFSTEGSKGFGGVLRKFSIPVILILQSPPGLQVVRSGQGVTDLQDQRNKDMESRLKEYNKRHRSKDSHGEHTVQKAA